VVVTWGTVEFGAGSRRLARGTSRRPIRSSRVLHRSARRPRTAVQRALYPPASWQATGTAVLLGPTGDAVRITYYLATGRRIILLTVFRKQRRRERAEVDRAIRVMESCIAEGHIGEDEDE